MLGGLYREEELLLVVILLSGDVVGLVLGLRVGTASRVRRRFGGKVVGVAVL